MRHRRGPRLAATAVDGAGQGSGQGQRMDVTSRVVLLTIKERTAASKYILSVCSLPTLRLSQEDGQAGSLSALLMVKGQLVLALHSRPQRTHVLP